jgi:hypothetical protein
MEFEQFRDFMLQSAAKHDAQISTLQEMVKSLVSTVEMLAENQSRLQKSMNDSFRRMALDHEATQTELRELSRIVFRHVSDPDAHSRL